MNQTDPLTGVAFTPTLSGHRLAIAGDVAIVVDPEGTTEDGQQPQVLLASLSQHRLLSALALPVGANPQAVVTSSDGYAYVLAAGLGGVYAVDIANQRLGAFAKVCPAPADLAVNGTDIIVACRSGEVVTLTAKGATTQMLQPGLTRVAVDTQGNIFVATASAEIIQLGVPGSPSVAPPQVQLPDGVRVEHANSPRRLLALPSGGVLMLYQQSLSGELTQMFFEGGPALPPSEDLDGGFTGEGGGGEGGGAGGGDGSPYSGDGPCAVPATRPTFTTFTPGSGFTGQRWTLGTLAVDAAASPDGTTLAVADSAGGGVRLESLTQPRPAGDDDTCFAGNVQNTALDDTPVAPTPNTMVIATTMPSAVAYAGTTLVVLTSAPSLQLQTVQQGQFSVDSANIVLRPRALSEGFTLFHQDPQPTATVPGGLNDVSGLTHQSLACASCHPDGMSNGATTTINGVTRRVMPLAGRLANATLVHWEAESFHDAVAEHTWHENMGGTELTASQEASLRDYLAQLQLPARPTADAAQVAAGAQAFAKAGCATCHTPANAFTNNGTADVGRGLHKVPSLAGLIYTAPYMSDGCATTLEVRFDDVACGGGANHGNVAALSNTELSALITYLKTL